MTLGSYVPVGTEVKYYGQYYIIIEVKEESGIFFNTYEYTLQTKDKKITYRRCKRSEFTVHSKLW